MPALVGIPLQMHPLVAGIGFASLAFLWLGEKFLPSRPIALFLVVISVAFVSMISLAGHVGTVGAIPSGLPRFSPPMLRIEEVDGILPLAFAALLLSYIESVSAGRTFAAKYGYKLHVRQELLGLGSANLFAAFGQGYPVAGGLSQSAVNEQAGAETPLSLILRRLWGE